MRKFAYGRFGVEGGSTADFPGDGLQAAKPGHSTYRDAFQKAVIRTMFDEPCGKWSIEGKGTQGESDCPHAILSH